MQVIAAHGTTRLVDRIVIARGLAVGVLLLVAGGAMACLFVATPLVTGFIPYGRPSPAEVAAGIAVWGFAIVVPALFAILGVARLASVIDSIVAARPRQLTQALASALGPGQVGVTGLVLDDGRRVPELVVGPFGVAILGDTPPRGAARRAGGRWEMRDDRNRWMPIEDPVQRAGRDAERLRGWLASDDRDFLVRVYAAIVTTEPGVERSPSCAVIAPAELAGWLQSLPPQRGLTPNRYERLMELFRAQAGAPGA